MQQLTAKLAEAERMEKKALELRQRIFGSRIVSRTDVGDLGRDVKSLKRIFPCGGTMAVVVDDREDVWANAEAETREPPHNLLLVKPYHWKPFMGFANVNNDAGIDITTTNNNNKNTNSSSGGGGGGGDGDYVAEGGGTYNDRAVPHDIEYEEGGGEAPNGDPDYEHQSEPYNLDNDQDVEDYDADQPETGENKTHKFQRFSFLNHDRNLRTQHTK
uniref:protein-serine/threonine phosphatase n=1 Tax=Cyclophora tenuis TaxID=216820 RepID=A0A7S1CXJ8_CYCTE